jgi:hypothetical protein
MLAKKTWPVVLVLGVLVVVFSSPQVAPADVPQDNHFTIVQGVIAGGAQPITVTIRLDSRTGNAWILRSRIEPTPAGPRTHIEWGPIEELTTH